MKLYFYQIVLFILSIIFIIEGIRINKSTGFFKPILAFDILGMVFSYCIVFVELFNVFNLMNSYSILGLVILLFLIIYLLHMIFKIINQRNIIIYDIDFDVLYEQMILLIEEHNILYKKKNANNFFTVIYIDDSKGEIKLQESMITSKVVFTFKRYQEIEYYDDMLLKLQNFVENKNKNKRKLRGIGRIILGIIIMIIGITML